VRIYVTGPVPSAIASALAEDFELSEAVEGADGVLSLLTTTVDAEFLDRAGPQLKIVANYAVGVNNIDFEAARARGVLVTNTPDVLTRPTAELTVTLMLSLMRRVTEGDRLIRRREPWGFSLEFMLGESLDGKLVGIVGPGRIGRETARLVEAFGARTAFAGRGDDLRDVLRTADVVSLHCPLTPETHHLIDAAALAAMKPTAVLVNAARGPVVDERALVEALQAGTIAGAALDVYEDEPRVAEELLTMENVLLCPHLGSATRPTREGMGMLAVNALRSVLLRGELPPNLVSVG
jgi:lactate dehydrogenase-like 2-hydroxyacid dehydrogenase